MKQTKRKIILLLFIANCTLQIAVAQPTQEWVARYERPSGSSGIANQMALDKVGNCYVLGNAPVNGSYGGIILIKYNSSGDTLWTRSYNQGAGNAAGHVNLISDSIGNVYVTGRTGIGSFGPYDIVTIKYNPQGVQQWLKIFDTGGNDQPTDITMDKQNNVYIGGLSENESLIIKYNAGGDTLWTRRYTEAGFSFPGISITLDSRNNVYLAGLKGNISNGTQNYYTMKYDSTGLFKWVTSYNLNVLAALSKVKVDLSYNVFVTGQNLNGRILTIKYDSNGVEQWQRVYSSPVTGGDRATDMGIDNFGNIIITGYGSGVGVGNFDYVTIKYSTSGDSLWVKRFNGAANDNDEAYSLALDDSDNIYVTGRSINIGVSWDYLTIKYSSLGAQLWTALYNNNANDIAFKVAVDKNSNVYVTGISDRGGIIYDYVTVKYTQPVGIIPISITTPERYRLYQNYPNPFNPTTKIKYQVLKSNSDVKIVVFDLVGKEIKTIVNAEHAMGDYEVAFDANEFANGVYFYRLTVNNEVIDTKKMMFLK